MGRNWFGGGLDPRVGHNLGQPLRVALLSVAGMCFFGTLLIEAVRPSDNAMAKRLGVDLQDGGRARGITPEQLEKLKAIASDPSLAEQVRDNACSRGCLVLGAAAGLVALGAAAAWLRPQGTQEGGHMRVRRKPASQRGLDESAAPLSCADSEGTRRSASPLFARPPLVERRCATRWTRAQRSSAAKLTAPSAREALRPSQGARCVPEK